MIRTYATDISNTDTDVIIEMHLPDINAEKIDIKIEDNILYVSGSREKKIETEDRDYYQKEIEYGEFEQSLTLPCAVKKEALKFDYKNGTLRICLPKKHK